MLIMPIKLSIVNTMLIMRTNQTLYSEHNANHEIKLSIVNTMLIMRSNQTLYSEHNANHENQSNSL